MQLIVVFLLVSAVPGLWGAAVPFARNVVEAPLQLEYQEDNRVIEMCDKSAPNERLAHPIHCNRFISCTSNGPVIFECPGHLMYSIVKKLCDWPENVECGDQEKILRDDETPQLEMHEPEMIEQVPEVIEKLPAVVQDEPIKEEEDNVSEKSESSEESSSSESESEENGSTVDPTDEEHEGEVFEEPSEKPSILTNESQSNILPYKLGNPTAKDPTNTRIDTCWCYPLCPLSMKNCPPRPSQMPAQYKTIMDVIGNDFFKLFDPNFNY